MTERLQMNQLNEICVILDRGGVVALPTDTVYGVGARLDRPEGVARLFALKDRPTSVALPVLVGTRSQLARLAVTTNETIDRVLDALWPGALTVVMNADATLAARVGATRSTLGVRMPNDEALLRLLELSGPLAVTSANRHGDAPCVTAGDVEAAFGDCEELDAIIDGGRREAAVSTVIDATSGQLTVLRQGAISEETLQRLWQEN